MGLFVWPVGVTGVWANDWGIQGSITDSWEGNPLAGVNVTVRGTTLATRADLQGRFALTGVPQGNHILIFTKSGYARASISMCAC